MMCSKMAQKRSSARFYFMSCIFSFLILHLYLRINNSIYAVERVNESLNSKLLHCYESVENDVLQSAEDANFSPGDKPIFFLETSCKGTLDARQACAVESAARFHPDSHINVMFTSPITEHNLQTDILQKLGEYQNIKFVRIHAKEFSKGTGVESIISERLKESHFPIEHASDVLRMVTLNKFGGIYLDTDMLVVNNLDDLPRNWIARDKRENIGIGAMRFSKDAVGANMTRRFLKELEKKPIFWSYGNGAVTRVFLRICPDVFRNNELVCKGVTILPYDNIYPFSYDNATYYFFKGNKNNVKYYNVSLYMYHTWYALTKKLSIKNDSPYDKLAWYCCPSIRRTYGDMFTNPLD